jgi:hypothetical protein
MTLLLLLVARSTGNSPPPGVLVFTAGLFLVLLPLLASVTNRLMGIPALYRDFPADPTDPIEESLGWRQVEFGALRGHSPMVITFGRRCLHLKQPFPFQPAWWRGPASIPWREVVLEKEAQSGGWAFLSAAEFRLGADGRVIRLRGKAARRLQDRVKAGQGPGGPPNPTAIRPR